MFVTSVVGDLKSFFKKDKMDLYSILHESI